MTNNIEPIEFLDDDMLDLVEELESPPQEICEPTTKSEFIAPIKEIIEELSNGMPESKHIAEVLKEIINIVNAFKDDEFSAIYERTNQSPMPNGTKEIDQKQKEFEKMLPTLQSKLPEWHTMPIQKLVTELQHNLINSGAADIIVANKGKKNEITSYVLATCNEVDSIISLTEFDRQVQDAISSLWEYGHKDHIITPDIVARAMNHKTQTEYISPQYKGAVTKSIEKMRRIHITLDASEEVRKRKAILDEDPNISCKIDDYLLSFKGIEVGAGGKTVKGYLMQAEPLLLTYAKMTKQLATVDARLLDIKKVSKNGKATTVSIVNTEPRTAVKGYLLRRIAVMNNDRTKKTHKQSNIILFDTLFEETGIPQDNNSANTKKYAFQVLDYFKAMNYIKGYTKRKNRKSFDAVIINL